MTTFTAQQYADAVAAVIAQHDCEGQLDDGTTVVYCERPATVRATGEMDSFGTEYLYFCQDCADDFYEECRRLDEQEHNERQSKPCQRCKQLDEGNIRQRRSTWDERWEEPSWLCRACRKRDQQEEDEEMCRYDRQDAERAGKPFSCWCGDSEHKAVEEANAESERIWAEQKAECEAKLAIEPGFCICGTHDDSEYAEARCGERGTYCYCGAHPELEPA